jgi:hypothetical protein
MRLGTRESKPVRSLSIVAALILLAASSFAGDFRIWRPAYVAVDPGLKPNEWGPFMHWDLREMPNCTVPWTMGTNPVPSLDGDTLLNEPADRDIARATFQASFARWDAVAPSELNFLEIVSAVPAGGLIQDGWNTISFGDIGPDGFGVTDTFREVSTGRIIESDVVLNSNPNALAGGEHRLWVVKAHGSVLDRDHGPFDYNGNGIRDWECDAGKTATHEIGHFIGLVHNEPLGGCSNDSNNPLMEQYTCSTIGPRLGGWTNIVLKDPDKDGENFLYCPDLGDAPDPWMGVFNQYPTLVHEPKKGRMLNGVKLDKVAKGAEHIFGIKERQPGRNWTYEWLARRQSGDVDAECEANIVDKDPLDDGVSWYPNPPVWGRKMTVVEWMRYATDNVGDSHDYTAHALWGNAWLDVNQNCIWEEHFLHWGLSIAPLPPFPNQIFLTLAKGSIALPLVVNPDLPVWLRCRVDWGEDVGTQAKIDSTLNGPEGAAQHGEVEDYPFYCTTRYEQMWFCYPFPLPFPRFSMVVIGAPDPSDQTFSAVVDQNDCVQTINPAPAVFYVPSADETVGDFPVPSIPPFPPYYFHFGWCRPNYPPASPPYVTARAHMVTEVVPAGTPAQFVPPYLRIPTVNCAYRTYQPGQPSYGNITFTVGAVDFENGGWIDGPDSLTREWDDTLRVDVRYRVSSNQVPLASLSPCNPIYSSLPLTTVGSGMVTPEDAFEFSLSIPGDAPAGSYVILEVDSRWSTNGIVNHQIIEFPRPFNPPTGADDTPRPSRLALENYPNPFNPTTIIRYALPEPAAVTLEVFDVAGRLVQTLVRGKKRPAGVFEAEWNGTDSAGRPVSSGVYFYRLHAGTESLTRKAVLLK